VQKISWRSWRQRVCRIVLASVAVAILAPTAHAGFFDFLFNPPRAANPSREIYSPFEPPRPVTIRPMKRQRPRLIPDEAPKLSIALCCKDGEDPTASLMKDPTLRPGDAVMTSQGIRIFEGHVSSHHAMAEFLPLARVANVTKPERVALVQIDAREGAVLPAQASFQKSIKAKTLDHLPTNIVQLEANR
jgi:hypothetical protein